MRSQLLAFVLALAQGAVAQNGLPPTIDASAKLTKLATLNRESYSVDAPFTEGATRDPATGDVYFVEQNANKILKWSVSEKKMSVFMHPAGYSNGMTFDRFGKLIACADERNQLWEISTNQTASVPWPAPANPSVGDRGSGNVVLPVWKVIMDGKYNGKLLGGPNDVWVMPDNSLYFTDPMWPRKYWTNPNRANEQGINTVYRLSADRKTLTRALTTFSASNGQNGSPNGIIASPDGKTLYVASLGVPSNAGNGETYAYDIGADGSLSNRRVWAQFGSDGMTMDNAGNMYMTGGNGVRVVSIATGKQVGFITVPEQTANLAFGGVDQSVLYITARTGFYSIQTKVKGAHLVK